MARLHSDENFDRHVVEELRKYGHDVLTAREAGRDNRRIPDTDVLAFATAQGRAVVTFNRGHFKRLHRTTPSHRGIIVRTDDRDVVALAARIHQAIEILPTLDGQLISIVRPST